MRSLVAGLECIGLINKLSDYSPLKCGLALYKYGTHHMFQLRPENQHKFSGIESYSSKLMNFFKMLLFRAWESGLLMILKKSLNIAIIRSCSSLSLQCPIPSGFLISALLLSTSSLEIHTDLSMMSSTTRISHWLFVSRLDQFVTSSKIPGYLNKLDIFDGCYDFFPCLVYVPVRCIPSYWS